MTMKKKNIIIAGIGAALATAATIFFLKKKKTGQENKPLKKAPQLSIENPGEQSDFTTAASESEIG
jgi:LPXTG-motif cell wall-anchored protein